MTPRIAPLSPPFAPAVDALLAKMNPPGAPGPLALFRVLAHHPELADRMRVMGSLFLGRVSTLSLRDREVVIDRVCARCGAEYEWGVHVAAFAQGAGFTPAQVDAIADPASDDAALTERDRLLVQWADELHDTASVSDGLWDQMSRHWSEPQRIELMLLAGWYHGISYVCNAARVPLEDWAARWPAR